MAVRNDFAAGEVLAAADLNDTFASKLPYSYGTATPTTSVDGFLWYDENDTPPTPKFWDGAAFQALTSGKILQVLRATDSTNRSTTSSAFVDASISVTITPQKSDSAVLLIWKAAVTGSGLNSGAFQITDSSNNAISGAESNAHTFGGNGWGSSFILIAYATPATTSAVTYKVRFKNFESANTTISNAAATGQLFAIEVSA